MVDAPPQENAAKAAVARLLEKSTRRQINADSRPVVERFTNLHGAGWGRPKSGKTHIGLDARSDEVYLTKTAGSGTFAKPVKDRVLIPSEPLVIAHANFDRDAATVHENLHPGFELIEEPFYLDDNGNQLWMPEDADILRLLERLKTFVRECSGVVDLFVLDGATIIWEDVRTVRLGEPAGKDPDNPNLKKHLPRQYNAANTEMRHSVMQMIYDADFHSWLTLEAGDQWSGQNRPDTDAYGNVIQRMDGWNRTGYYSDVVGQVRLVELADPKGPAGATKWTRQYIIGEESINKNVIGRTITDPTFQKIYQQVSPKLPLLKREARPLFASLLEEHGAALAWGETE